MSAKINFVETMQGTTPFNTTKPHYELLDGLRGVAAILVLFYHIFEGFAFAEITNGEGNGIIGTLNHGHIAVDFFFMLSGFVVSYAYDDRWREMHLGEFFKRRLIRLHPMLIAGAIIGAITFFAVGCKTWNGTVTPTVWVVTAMLLTMFMIPASPGTPYEVRGNGEMFPLNGPTWSLFFEYIGNIVYALVIRRLPTKVLVVLTLLLGIAHTWFFVSDVSGYDMVGVGWTIDSANFCGGLVRMLFPFSVGILLSRKFKPRKIRGAFWICSLLLIMIFSMPYISKTNHISWNSLYEVFCIAIVFPIIVWLGACGQNEHRYTTRLNKLLGEISYPLYIVHYPIMYIFYAWLIEKRVYTFSETWIVSSIVVVVSILLAFLFLKFYDEPVRKLLSKKQSKN